MLLLLQDLGRVISLCDKPGDLAQLLATATPSPPVAEDLATLLCSTLTGSAMAEIQSFMDIDKLEAKVHDNELLVFVFSPCYFYFSLVML